MVPIFWNETLKGDVMTLTEIRKMNIDKEIDILGVENIMLIPTKFYTDKNNICFSYGFHSRKILCKMA